MTRKDYKLIATALVMATVPTAHMVTMAAYLADELERDNPRFDRARFYAACGIKATK